MGRGQPIAGPGNIGREQITGPGNMTRCCRNTGRVTVIAANGPPMNIVAGAVGWTAIEVMRPIAPSPPSLMRADPVETHCPIIMATLKLISKPRFDVNRPAGFFCQSGY
jgi:hypothetical protein